MDPIALAIPAFFGLMGLEWLVARVKGRSVYRFADWVGNLGCGIIQQTFKLVLATFTFIAYAYLFSNHRLFELDAGAWWVWALCFLGVDFCYYWFHRMSHELNFMWAAHVVHHQSEEYNLGVALRQSAFQGGFSWAFYLPLAILGFPPLVFGVVAALNTLYQFWIHTQLIGRMGPLEWVINTPSHHRVHHGQNPQYIDKNHAGTLIIWDRLFGTFAPEEEEVIYGVTEPPNRWNPVFANFHHVALSFRRSLSAKTWSDRLAVWWRRPGFVPEGVADDAKRTDPLSKYDTLVSRPLVAYVAVHFGLLAAATTWLLFVRSGLEPVTIAAVGALIIATAGNLGAVLDGAPWARAVERIRPLAVAATAIALWPEALLPLPAVGLLAAAAGSAFAFERAVGAGREIPALTSPAASGSILSAPSPRSRG